jgi:hypothetical protein
MKKNQILIILVPSFIFVIAWIGFSVYHNIITSTISDSLSVQIAPIAPSFDTNTIGALKNRLQVTPIYNLGTPSQNSVPQASPSAAPVTPTPTPPAGNSAGSQQATSGGSLTP